MKYLSSIIIVMAMCIGAQAEDMQSMTSPIKIEFGHKSVKMGFDLLSLKAFAGDGEKDKQVGGSDNDQGMWSKAWGYTKENPVKVGILTLAVLGAGYAVYDSKGGGGGGSGSGGDHANGNGDNRDNDSSSCNFTGAVIKAPVTCDASKSEESKEE